MGCKGFRAFALSVVFLSAIPAWATVLVGPLVNGTNGHKYFLLSQNTWTGAQAEAVSLGGNLATVRNAGEEAFITSNFAHFGGVTRDLWIGLTDAGHEGTFTWVSGEPFIGYTNWQVGQPDNGAGAGPENYVHIYYERGGTPHFAGWVDDRWNDFTNVDSYAYLPGVTATLHGVVEVVPEPTGLSALGLVIVLTGMRRGNRQA
jgi:Lectin C-type domain